MQATKWSNSGQSSEEGASLTSAFYIMGSSHWMSFICCFLTVILPKYSHIFHPGSCRRFKFGVYSDAKSNDHTLPDVCMVSFTSASSKNPLESFGLGISGYTHSSVGSLGSSTTISAAYWSGEVRKALLASSYAPSMDEQNISWPRTRRRKSNLR